MNKNDYKHDYKGQIYPRRPEITTHILENQTPKDVACVTCSQQIVPNIYNTYITLFLKS